MDRAGFLWSLRTFEYIHHHVLPRFPSQESQDYPCHLVRILQMQLMGSAFDPDDLDRQVNRFKVLDIHIHDSTILGVLSVKVEDGHPRIDQRLDEINSGGDRVVDIIP